MANPVSELHDAAIKYAELGYRVFPCAPGTKIPLTEHGFKDGTTDIAQECPAAHSASRRRLGIIRRVAS